MTAELSGGVERGKGGKAASRSSSPPRSPPAVTTTGRTRPRISGLRSCWPATRIDLRQSLEEGRPTGR